jgi:hypothetical protein
VRALVLVALVGSLGTEAVAEKAPPPAETQYEGARLGFVIPGGATVKEATDIVADYALDVTLPPALELGQVQTRILLGKDRVLDLDVDAAATAWRDARLKNRGAWGVKKKTAPERGEVTHIGARRFLRLDDQVGSALGASTQVMLCGAVSARLLCGVISGPNAKIAFAEKLLSRMLETASVKKK